MAKRSWSTIGPRTYRVLNLGKCTSPGKMHVNVKVSGQNVRGEYCYHGDTFDMESFPAARGVHQASARTNWRRRKRRSTAKWASCGRVLGDLQREMAAKDAARPTEETIMTAEEEAAAMELLRDPRLLDRVLEDFEQMRRGG